MMDAAVSAAAAASATTEGTKPNSGPDTRATIERAFRSGRTAICHEPQQRARLSLRRKSDGAASRPPAGAGPCHADAAAPKMRTSADGNRHSR